MEYEEGTWVFADPRETKGGDDEMVIEGAGVGAVTLALESGSELGSSDDEDQQGEFDPQTWMQATSQGLSRPPVSLGGVLPLLEGETVSAPTLAGIPMDTNRRAFPLERNALRRRGAAATRDARNDAGDGGTLDDGDDGSSYFEGSEAKEYPAGAGGSVLMAGRAAEPQNLVGPSRQPGDHRFGVAGDDESLSDVLTIGETYTPDELLKRLSGVVNSPIDTSENREAAYQVARLAHKLLVEQHKRYAFVEMAANKVLERQRVSRDKSVAGGSRFNADRAAGQTAERWTLAPTASLQKILSEFTRILHQLRWLQQRQTSLLQTVYDYQSSFWATETRDTSSGVTETTHVSRDGRLGPVVPWEMSLVLRQWHQSTSTSLVGLWTRFRHIKTKWKPLLEHFVRVGQDQRTVAEPGSNELRQSLLESTSDFVEYLETISKKSPQAEAIGILERQCRLFVLRWRVELAFQTYHFEIVHSFHPLRPTTSSQAARKMIRTARQELYPPSGYTPPPPKAANDKAASAAELKPNQVVPEWGGEGSDWVNDITSPDNIIKFVALDLRVRLLATAWSLEQLAGQHAIQYSVRRCVGIPTKEHISAVGDVLISVRTTEAGIEQAAVQAGYPLQVVESFDNYVQPNSKYLRIDEARKWLEKWLHRRDIRDDQDAEDDVSALSVTGRQRVWYDIPHNGPYARYTRSIVYRALWRRFRTEEEGWEKDSVGQVMLSEADTRENKVETVRLNLARRTPASVFFPADRPRLLYYLLRSVLWIDGEAPSFDERSAHVHPMGKVSSPGITNEACSLHVGPDVRVVHDPAMVDRLTNKWDLVKDRMVQSLLEGEGQPELTFAQGLRSYYGEHVGLLWWMSKSVFIALVTGTLLMLTIRYLVVETVVRVLNSTCSPKQDYNTTAANGITLSYECEEDKRGSSGMDIATVVNLWWGGLLVIVMFPYLIWAWNRKRLRASVWWGLPDFFHDGELALATPEQFILRRSWLGYKSWYSALLVSRNWLLTIGLILFQMGAFVGFVLALQSMNTSDSIDYEYATSQGSSGVLLLGFGQAGVYLIARYLFNFTHAGGSVTRTASARSTLPPLHHMRGTTDDFEPFGGAFFSGKDWRRDGATAITAMNSNLPVVQDFRRQQNRHSMYQTKDERHDVVRWLVFHLVSHLFPALYLRIADIWVTRRSVCFNCNCEDAAFFNMAIINWTFVLFEVLRFSWSNKLRANGSFTIRHPWSSPSALDTPLWTRTLKRLSSQASETSSNEEQKAPGSGDNSWGPEGNPLEGYDFMSASRATFPISQVKQDFVASRKADLAVKSMSSAAQVFGLAQAVKDLAPVPDSSKPGLKGGAARNRAGRQGARPRAAGASGGRRGGNRGNRRPGAGAGTGAGAGAGAGAGSGAGRGGQRGNAKSPTPAKGTPGKAEEGGSSVDVSDPGVQDNALVLPLDSRQPYEEAELQARLFFAIGFGVIGSFMDPTTIAAAAVYVMYSEDSYLGRLILTTDRRYPHRLRTDMWSSGIPVLATCCLFVFAMITGSAFDFDIDVNLSRSPIICQHGDVRYMEYGLFVLCFFILGMFITFVLMPKLFDPRGRSERQRLAELKIQNDAVIGRAFDTAQRTELLSSQFEHDGKLKPDRTPSSL